MLEIRRVRPLKELVGANVPPALRGKRGRRRLLGIKEGKRRKEREWLDLLSGARYGGNTRPDLMMLERREERNEAITDIAEDASQHWTATVEDKPDA